MTKTNLSISGGLLKLSRSKRKLIAPPGKLFCCPPAILLFFAANTFVPCQIPSCLLELTCPKPEMPPRPSLCTEAMERRCHFPLRMPQAVLCGVSALLSICHWWLAACTHTRFWGKATGLSQTFFMLSGPGAMQPGLQLWTSPGLDSAAHVHGQREAARLLPTLSLGVLVGLSPKPRSQMRQKWFLKPPGEPFEELADTSKCQLTQALQEAFSVLQGAQFIHKIRLPHHTLAGQLCPLSLSSPAC